jgi:hypothetical protein
VYYLFNTDRHKIKEGNSKARYTEGIGYFKPGVQEISEA